LQSARGEGNPEGSRSKKKKDRSTRPSFYGVLLSGGGKEKENTWMGKQEKRWGRVKSSIAKASHKEGVTCQGTESSGSERGDRGKALREGKCII